ncbi:MAG: branched-chain amino acid ABC transporter permease [Burkholderiales bacterium]|nr:branched-chain amino acid ABC transporter permease [Burkholderiales bacterium]MDE2394868.1 branched-chain amino acid ABC transporter permease [Burkholderiales bacterium]MDE2453715.1 branched-chain amino acid ABC transporter permease [Burkholderiales bacterium]
MSPWAVWVENLLQSLVAGFTVGALYGLMCVGLALIFSVMRVINFAQGELLVAGMYAALFLFGPVGLGGLLGPYLGPVAAALGGGVVVFGLGAALYQTLLRPISGLRARAMEGEGHSAQLTLTLGVSLVLSNGALLLFGSSPQSLATPMSSNAWEFAPLGDSGVTVFLNQARTVAALIALAVAGGCALFIARARTGKILRAAADNPEAATYMGIGVDRAYRLAFGLGAAVTGIAGGLVASYLPFQPYTGIEFVMVMYAGVVLGGMGSVGGAFVGGLVIGLVQQLSSLVLPQQLQNTAVFVIFLLVLLLRPQGLFGRSVERV